METWPICLHNVFLFFFFLLRKSFIFLSYIIQMFPSLSYFTSDLVSSFYSGYLELPLEEGGKILPVAVMIETIKKSLQLMLLRLWQLKCKKSVFSRGNLTFVSATELKRETSSLVSWTLYKKHISDTNIPRFYR